MIVDVWRPRFDKLGGKKIIKYYEKVETESFLTGLKKGWIARYYCDMCKSDKISTTTTHVLFNPNVKFNTIKLQTCRGCRSRISEYEVKKTYIPFDTIQKSILESNYKLLSTEGDYMSANNRSQFKHKIICDIGHNLTTTWNNWSKGKRCRICYEQKKFENAVKYKNGWERYSFLVWYYTEKSYKQYEDIINTKKLKRGKKYHLDHKYSIFEGFNSGVSPKIIGEFYNLEIITSHENLKKNKKCSITLNELLKYEKNN
jgi:hypothetical protein